MTILANSVKGFGQKFSHRPAMDLAAFSSTANLATQAIAIDANAQDIQSTGTGACMINGDYIVSLPVDAALDISADLQFTIWVTAQSYTTGMYRYVTDANGLNTWYKCIADHTSAATNKPGQPGNGEYAYWKISSQTAVNANGTAILDGYMAYFAVLANRDGELSIVRCGDVVLDADILDNLKIPNFEPEDFALVSIMLVDSDSDDFVLGTVTVGALTGLDTHYQVIGSVVPAPENQDKN